MDRNITFSQAINEALDQSMARDPSVYVMALGAPDPKGIFGTTLGLQEKYGTGRVLDMPASENAMTGVAIGSALVGQRPVLVHQRLDFALLSMEQIVNQAAKWHYLFAGQSCVPLVIRMIIGRGWGQGPQHSQSLQAWFAHIPGLKVVMPSSPFDAKGLLMASIQDDNPVMFIEHRWLHGIVGPVPEKPYTVPIGEAWIVCPGGDVTIVATSFMVIEALRAAVRLRAEGIEAEVVNLRSLRPLDTSRVLASVKKTGRLVVADTGWMRYGISAEIVAVVAESLGGRLQVPPRRVALPNGPTPTTHALADRFYPTADDLVAAVRVMLGRSPTMAPSEAATGPLDVPATGFSGPF